MGGDGDVAMRKARTERVFTEMAHSYDQGGPGYFSRFGERLIEYAGLRPGQRVLDVATGRGAILMHASRAVGPQGSVTGVDLSPAMIDATRAEIVRRGVANAEVRVMDAETLEFPDGTFDVVLCGFALMFFPRLQETLAELRRVLAPNGMLAVSTFASDLGQLVDPVLNRYRGDVRNPLAQDLATPDEVRAALDGAGLSDIDVREESLVVTYPDAERYWSWHMGLLTGVWFRAQPPDVQQRVEADALAHLTSIQQPDGIHETLVALFGKAKRE